MQKLAMTAKAPSPQVLLFASAMLITCCTPSLQVALSQTLPALPDDPLFDSQWYLFSAEDARGQPGSINAVAAWEHVEPAEPVMVAVLGGGINFTHPDLVDNIWSNPHEARNLRDDDDNGFIDDLHGWDFASNDCNPVSQPYSDQNDHDSNDYAPVSHMGTSWSAPIAAAIAATLISQEPELTPEQVSERLRRCSVRHESMSGKLGGGRIDMLRTITNRAGGSSSSILTNTEP